MLIEVTVQRQWMFTSIILQTTSVETFNCIIGGTARSARKSQNLALSSVCVCACVRVSCLCACACVCVCAVSYMQHSSFGWNVISAYCLTQTPYTNTLHTMQCHMRIDEQKPEWSLGGGFPAWAQCRCDHQHITTVSIDDTASEPSNTHTCAGGMQEGGQ